MYTLLGTLFSLTTAFMFLRMHHLHGSDTNEERIIIVIGCVLFLLQAGITYQQTLSRNAHYKRIVTIVSLFCTIGFGALFFWFVDFNRDSIFSLIPEF